MLPTKIRSDIFRRPVRVLGNILFGTVLLFITASAWSDPLSGPSLTADKPGQYVVYRDTRAETLRYIGILLVAENHYLVRSYVPSTGGELRLHVKVAVEGGIPKIDSLAVQMGDRNSGLINSLSVDLLNIVAQRSRFSDGLFPDPVELSDPRLEEGYTLEHSYRFWIPLFQLFSSVRSDNPGLGLFLVHAGELRAPGDPLFFEFGGIPDRKPGPSFVISAKQGGAVQIDGLRIPLDGNWEKESERLYRIRSVTDQDAAFFLESVDLNRLGVRDINLLMKYMLLANPDKILLAEDVELYEFKEMPVIEFSTLDPETGIVTRQVSLFMPRGGRIYSIGSLSAFEPLFSENEAYFDRILF